MKTTILDTERKILTVSQITGDIRAVLEENFSGVWVEGEISNFKWHSSGHMYFSLKDENAQLQSVMFRSENARLGFEPKEGLSVLCYGRISVYPVRGQHQLYVERIEPKGVGALQLKFQQLKEKLQKEGLFDESAKKPIPALPRRIGVITSIDGAALKDILNVLERRFSNAQVLIHPAPVQGAGAAAAIAQNINDLNTLNTVDVMIVGRGGGSLEDLWAFNEEVVARAIFASRIPVISAVGHEVDFTIADFVADLRAPTPSAAAELVMPEKSELLLRLAEQKKDLLAAMTARLKDLKQGLKSLAECRSLRDPLAVFEAIFQRLDELKKNLRTAFGNFLSLEKERFLSLTGKLEALGPLATLKRGFSVTLDAASGKVISSFAQVKKGQMVRTKLKNGFLISQVKEAQGG